MAQRLCLLHNAKLQMCHFWLVFCFTHVCLSVCLSISQNLTENSYQQIFVKFKEFWDYGSGSDPEH